MKVWLTQSITKVEVNHPVRQKKRQKKKRDQKREKRAVTDEKGMIKM